MQGFVRQFTLLQDEVREMQEYMSAAQAPDTDGEPDPELMGIEDAPDQLADQSAHAQEPSGQSAHAQGPSREEVEQYARDLSAWEDRMMRDSWRRRRNRDRSSRSRSRTRRRDGSRDRRRRRDRDSSEARS